MVEIQLIPKASKLVRKGRAWLFADDLAHHDAAHGTLVRVRDDRDRDLGLGWFATGSKLALRMCGPWPGDEIPEPDAFFEARLGAAIARRDAWNAASDAGVRLAHGETDGLPGLVVDRYADCAVVQISAAAVERHRNAVVHAIDRLVAPRMILARNDIAVRKLEGLPRAIELLHGRRVDEVEIVEHELRHVIAPWTGQKTGFYLDQRPARRRTREFVADGVRVLDLFCYQGGFALNALAGGAASVLAVDQSDDALARAVAGAKRNQLAGLETVRANVFDLLRELRDRGERFDLIIVDPPAFAKSRRERDGGVRGYRELNRQAFRLLAPGGIVLSCSCSHHVTPSLFEDILRQAAVDVPFRLIVAERLMAGADHPVWLQLPESEYLKVVVLKRLD